MPAPPPRQTMQADVILPALFAVFLLGYACGALMTTYEYEERDREK